MIDRMYTANLRSRDWRVLASVISWDSTNQWVREFSRGIDGIVEFWSEKCGFTGAPVLTFQPNGDGVHIGYDSRLFNPAVSLAKASLMRPQPVAYSATAPVLPPNTDGDGTLLESAMVPPCNGSLLSHLSRVIDYLRSS